MTDRSTGERRLILQNRERGAAFDLYSSEKELAFYADGTSNAILSNHVTRVQFFEVKSVDYSPNEIETPIEERENIINVRMPTLAWARLAESIIRTLRENKKVIEAQANEQNEEINKIILSLEV